MKSFNIYYNKKKFLKKTLPVKNFRRNTCECIYDLLMCYILGLWLKFVSKTAMNSGDSKVTIILYKFILLSKFIF